jgi:hypothetical protein
VVVLVSEFAAGLMAKSEEFFLDGTFNTTECKLVLTILLALVDNVAIPCAYLLSNSPITKTYEWFFNVCIFFSFPFIIFHLLFHSLFYLSLTLTKIIGGQVSNQETDVAKGGVS